jgi:hypothetical protein
VEVIDAFAEAGAELRAELLSADKGTTGGASKAVRDFQANAKWTPQRPFAKCAKLANAGAGGCVARRFRYAPSTASPARTAWPAAHFDRNKIPPISGTGH